MCKKDKPNQMFTKGGVISAAISASRKTGRGMRSYYCSEHNCWHLTTQRKRRK